jgi:hypothetical protein
MRVCARDPCDSEARYRPAFVSVALLASVRIPTASTIEISDGIGRRAGVVAVAGVAELLAGEPIRGVLQRFRLSLLCEAATDLDACLAVGKDDQQACRRRRQTAAST